MSRCCSTARATRNLSQRGEERLLVALTIMRRFLDDGGGRKMIAASVIRRSYAETYLHLGQMKARKSRWAGLGWYLRALGKSPTLLEGWKELARLALPPGAERMLRRVLNRPATA